MKCEGDLEPSDEPAVVQGRVKWFDLKCGFGFIVTEDMPHDILLHVNVLRSFGYSTIAPDTGITVHLQKTARGFQADKIIAVVAPERPTFTHDRELVLFADELAELPVEAARIKWFSPTKGFGFATVFGQREDVFVHVDILRAAGLISLQSGEAVAIRSKDGERGRMAVQILPWDWMSLAGR